MSAWRADLAACGRSPTRRQAVLAWFANPGFALACHYRVAHWAAARGRAGRGLALLLERRMIARFACHLSARAEIGPGVRFPHPLAIVIGEGVVVGSGAVLYHGVTLGRRSARAAEYPRIGNDVLIYCGATVLGAVVVDDGAVVAARDIIAPPTAAARPRHSRPQRARSPG